VDQEEKQELQHGLEQLREKEYWQRLRVVQEYLLATVVNIWCGVETVDPEKIKWLIFLGFKTERLPKNYASELKQGRKTRGVHASGLSLKRHLDDFDLRMKCADVRDRIYGPLILITEDELQQLGLGPDHSLTAGELFV
jgi:hypothetical protein